MKISTQHADMELQTYFSGRTQFKGYHHKNVQGICYIRLILDRVVQKDGPQSTRAIPFPAGVKSPDKNSRFAFFASTNNHCVV